MRTAGGGAGGVKTMKRSLISAAVLTLLLPMFAVGASGPRDGKVSNETYVNAFFGLSYPLPDGFYQVDHPEKANAGPADLLLIADRRTDTPTRERLLIAADATTAYKLGAESYVKKFAHAIASQPGVTMLEDNAGMDLRGRHFYRTDWTQNYPGVILYKSFLCTSVRGYFLSWTFAATSQSRVQVLVETLQQAKFLGR